MSFTQDAQSRMYDKLTIKTRFIWKSGLDQMAVAGVVGAGASGLGSPGDAQRPACAIVQTASPIAGKVVTFVAERDGAYPKVPHPDSGDVNQALLSAELEVESPPLQEDGATHTYKVAGQYVYAFKRPFWLLDGLLMGGTPYDDTPAVSNKFGADNFVQGLMGNPSQVAG